MHYAVKIIGHFDAGRGNLVGEGFTEQVVRALDTLEIETSPLDIDFTPTDEISRKECMS